MKTKLKIIVIISFIMLTGACSGDNTDDDYHLRIPFITQAPPGDSENSENSFSACIVMLAGYFNRTIVNAGQITDQNDWLYDATGDYRYLSPNGWHASEENLSDYQELLSKMHGLSTFVFHGETFDDILDYGYDNFPVLAGVMTKNGELVSSGGNPHWVIVVGFNGYDVIVNDPGAIDGDSKYYSLDEFLASWFTQGNIYLPVSE